MAFLRHNIEKRRLIELVRLNPILWDCRLPHYKRSDKKKAIKWNELGRLFNVNGERVQRTFTSLREIFRRELNHEKMLGTRFKSKWEYYDAMAFLKEVIRERKSRERVKTSGPPALINNSNCIDEYQYFAPSDPNNPNNQTTQVQEQPQQQQQTSQEQQPQQQQPQQHLSAQSIPAPTPAPPLRPPPPPPPPPAPPAPPSISKLQETLQKPLTPRTPPTSQSIRLSTPPQLPIQLSAQAQHLQALQLQPDVTLTLQKLSANAQTAPAQITPAQIQTVTTAPLSNQIIVQAQTSPAQLLFSSRSCSSSPSIYIKDEPDSHEEDVITISTTPPNGKNQSNFNMLRLPAKKCKLPKTVQQPASKYITPPNVGELEYDDDDEDDEDFEDIATADVEMMDERSLGSSLTAAAAVAADAAQQQPSARELLYTKFGDFLAARLNTLHESVANELMNKILLLIAEK